MVDQRKAAVIVDYTNHRAERALRRVVPHRLVFENSEWHPETQWLLESTDLERNTVRFFAMAQVHGWYPEQSRPASIDASIAKQLQLSMERNARMRNRLLTMYRHPGCPIDVQRALESIDKDEEPEWHG